MSFRCFFFTCLVGFLASCSFSPEGHPRPKGYILSQPEEAQSTTQVSLK
ncbi:hypothetical protein AB751O23_AE_00050 [Chlamydiales bacterium SCGC AB-751-O23]|jgi:hypothetical protein|nr:hypothetical protein AB751O23_AE_00050 [Chlamydiales bacterium SCGC AB-751-O23]